jgi:hypothetical protein
LNVKFILTTGAVFLTAGIVTGFLAAWLLQYVVPSARLKIFRVGLVVSVIPHAVHAWSAYHYSTRWINLPHSPDPLGAYPGARAFLAFSVCLVLVLLLVAFWLAPRIPFAAGFLPAIVFTAYYHLAFDWLKWQAPGGTPIIDNVGTVWLFLISAGATVFLVVLAWSVFRFRTRGNQYCSQSTAN